MMQWAVQRFCKHGLLSFILTDVSTSFAITGLPFNPNWQSRVCKEALNLNFSPRSVTELKLRLGTSRQSLDCLAKQNSNPEIAKRY